MSTHKVDIMCLSETFLDSTISDEDPRLYIKGYKLFRSDHHLNIKQGGVCIYYKEYLSITERKDLTNLNECSICELRIGTNRVFLSTLYRSPSQTTDQFASFKQQFEETIINTNNCSPTLSLYLGDFNARNSGWFTNDTTNVAGVDLADLTSMYGLKQIINEPTHILPTSSSCIDLVFTSAENYIMDAGVLPSLFPRCHHQIVKLKVDFKIVYPPVYGRRIWDYSKADNISIRKAISDIKWRERFANLNASEKAVILTNTIKNVCSNYIPNKVIKIREKDAPWMNSEIKKALLEKAKLYRRYVKKGRRNCDYQSLNESCTRCKILINDRKIEYYKNMSDSLNDPGISSKKYWSILHRFLKKRKAPQIPPIRQNDILITDVSKKANCFNSFFANQCSLIPTDSNIPVQCFYTDKRKERALFDDEKVLSIIRSLDINKAHGWDEISVRMIKICDESIVPPLVDIFNSAQDNESFPSTWKRGNIIPCFKKGDKSLIKNYRPVSLLPIFGKIFEKCIFDSLYTYFEENNLLSGCQSGFRKGDSCTSQLLAIVENIFRSFDANPSIDTRGIFLDISKAFDRVWHEGLVFKLKSYGIKGPLLGLIKDFLSERLQRVVINGQESSWENILAGVPQGSILGPLLFLIYINDLPINIESDVKIFADDTSLFSKVNNPISSETVLNRDMERINTWANQWKMYFNPDVTKQAVEVYFSRKISSTTPPPVLFNGTPVSGEPTQKHLGLYLDQKLSFTYHLSEKISKVNKIIGMITRLRSQLPRNALLTIYKSFARPHLDYADIIYDNPGNKSFIDKLESIQYNAALAITGCIRGTSRDKIYAEIGIESLADRRYCRKLCFFYKIVKGHAPLYLTTFLPGLYSNPYSTRSNKVFNSIKARTEQYKNSFFPFCCSQWNLLDSHLREMPSIVSFKNALTRFYRPVSSMVYNVHHPKGIIQLNRLRVGFSHLKDHKFRHNFQDTIDPFCNCSTNAIETTEHYLLQCSDYSTQRSTLFDDLNKASINVLPYNAACLTRTLLFGNSSLSNSDNHTVITLVINYILQTRRFDRPLFD